MNQLERIFHLSQRETTVSREIRGGVTTFFAMAYNCMVIPGILALAGMDFGAAMAATCLTSGLCSILAGLFANSPFALGPGIGFATLFTYTICQDYGYTWQQGLALVFLSGLAFLALALSPLRERVTDALPMPFKFAMSAGLGMFLALSGLIQTGIIVADQNLLDMGAITDPAPLLSLTGILVMAVLLIKKVPGAIMIGMVLVVALGIPLGVTVLPDTLVTAPDLSSIFLQMDFSGLFSHGLLPLVSALLALMVSDFSDTVGTLLGVGGDAKLTDSIGNLPYQNRAILGDAAATCVGAAFGVSNVTTLAESAAGIREGARTGLASVVTGVLMLAVMPAAPLVGALSSVAMAAPLVILGMSMMSGISQIHWKHVEISLPCFLMIMGMPFTSSVTTGIMLGVISYVVVMVFRRRWALVDPVLYAMAAVFLLSIALK